MDLNDRHKLRLGLVAAAVLTCLGVGALVWADDAVARAVRQSGSDGWLKAKSAGGGRWLSDVMKFPGEWVAGAILAAVVGLLTPKGRRAQAIGVVVVAALLSSTNALIKWLVGRTRPFAVEGMGWHDFQPFRNGLIGLFQQTNLSFPSGHSSHAFAIAAAGWLVWPRNGGAFLFLLAVMTAAERVLSNSHYLSEVCVGAALGLCAALLARRVVVKLLPVTSQPLNPVH